MQRLEPVSRQIDQVTDYNQQKVLAAFNRARVSESRFIGTIGYGYGDRGRDTLDEVYAHALGAEGALVCVNFVSGTHASAVALFGVLRPGNTALSITGIPYDTLRGVLGVTGSGNGSFKEFGVRYKQPDLREDGAPDYEETEHRVHPGLKVVYTQRLRRYSLRPSLFMEDIERIAEITRHRVSGCIVVVDNCYGGFVQTEESIQHGTDLMAGSLIKSPGGGVVSVGGYIAGRRDLVESCSYHLTTPDTRRGVGYTLGNNRELFLGAFRAPNIAGEVLRTTAFVLALSPGLGYDVTPRWGEPRAGIIQAMLLREKETLIAFCRGIQKGVPVSPFVTPEPWDIPGYDCEVIMVAGAFMLRASIEPSTDAPLHEPFAIWMQGGLNFHGGRLGTMLAAQFMLERRILPLRPEREGKFYTRLRYFQARMKVSFAKSPRSRYSI